MGNNSGTENRNTTRKKLKPKSKARRAAEDIIILCLACICVVSGWRVWSIYHQYQLNRETYAKIAELAQPDADPLNIDFDALRKVNPDIVGWIYYEDTSINYPIVQGSDNDYYLNAAFDKTWSPAGCLFVDAITKDAFHQFNTIIYGHHMRDWTMFGPLEYLKDKSYCEEHPQFVLVTPEGKFHLKVCAFLNQPADSNIYTTNIHSDKGKEEYIQLVRSLAEYVTDEEMTPDDRLVVLSTCAYEYQNARYMVIAKMVPWKKGKK